MAGDYFETTALVRDGKLRLDDRTGFDDALRRFGDGTIAMRIEPLADKRSNAQNRFWHGTVIPAFMKELNGESPRDKHAFAQMKATLALELIPQTIVDMNGVEHVVPGHTADLSVAEFTDLITRAQQLGAKYGVYIPDSDEAQKGAA